MPSFFDHLEIMPEDPIFGLPIAFALENRKEKVMLGIGTYRDNNGNPVVLNCVRKAEEQIFSKNLNKEYSPMQGNAEMILSSLEILFGQDWEKMDKECIFGAQTIGGTGALRVGGEFLAQNLSNTIYISDPSWLNHEPIFRRAGMNVRKYPYVPLGGKQLNFSEMYSAIKEMPPKSVILLQASCHNPTGFDPNPEQWSEISELIKKRQIFPFFDLAYQGFGTGLDEDVKPIRDFVKAGIELFVMISYSKNLGLYGERLGTLVAVTSNPLAARKTGSHIKQIIRGSYSMAPLHSARILSTVWNSKDLREEWILELNTIRERIKKERDELAYHLQNCLGNERFAFLHQQRGMFSYCGIGPLQVERLRKEFAIFLPENGRINVAGLNQNNMDYVVNALCKVFEV